MRGQVDSRIRTAFYNGDEIYKLQGFVGYAIELIFEDGEAFAGTGGGDLEGVTIADEHRRLAAAFLAGDIDEATYRAKAVALTVDDVGLDA